MAALFWRCILGLQITLAAVIAVILAVTFSLSAASTVSLGVVAFLLSPAVIVASGFVIARALDHTTRAERCGMHSAEPASGAARRRVASAARMLWAQLTEAVAFGRAALAMIAEANGPQLEVGPPSEGRPARPLLLIHGIVCNRAIWRPWFTRLRAAGFAPIRAVNLEPLWDGIESCALTVEQQLLDMQRASGGARVTIVAHSMGGLVARAALRTLGPDVIRRIVTIASPHHGTIIARHLRWRPTQQMSPDSGWLEALNAEQEGLLPVPVASIYSLDDNLVVPARSAVLQGARNEELRGVGHMGLLMSPRAIACVMSELGSG